ncbi:MAG: hypothetical protein QM723_33340 [Myxococcaceae bacterium]
MIVTVLAWSVFAAGGATLDGCDASNPYLYFPYMDHGDRHVGDRETITVVPRPIIGLGTNWDHQKVNADFDVGIDLQLLACQVHPVRRFASHLLARARNESG